MKMSASSSSTKPQTERVRKAHTRSRAGCTTCRKRHIRCDEARPVCQNCRSSSRECHYVETSLPLRERRARERSPLPGTQDVWAVDNSSSTPRPSESPVPPHATPAAMSAAMSKGQVVAANSQGRLAWRVIKADPVNPFETMAIKMPFKSKQLFLYYYQSAESLGISHYQNKYDCFKSITQDPSSLRSALLLASIHYAWNHGSLSEYESTFLAHKIECIRAVNQHIVDASGKFFIDNMKQVATLALVEVAFGNLAQGEAHFDGLVALMDFVYSRPESTNLSPITSELAIRYMLTVYSFVHGMKSRVSNIMDTHWVHEPEAQLRPATPNDVGNLIHMHFRKETGEGIHSRLQLMRLIPYFFATIPKDTTPVDIDITEILATLQQLTQLVEERMSVRSTQEYQEIWNQLWMGGGIGKLSILVVKANVHSVAGIGPTEPWAKSQGKTSSWTGWTSSSGLYLNAVLGVWNAGQPMDARTLGLILIVLNRDVEHTQDVLSSPYMPQADVWLWKVFSGAASLTRNRGVGGAAWSPRLEILQNHFEAYLRAWSKASGTSNWQDAKSALRRVVWLNTSPHDRMVKGIWEAALRLA